MHIAYFLNKAIENHVEHTVPIFIERTGDLFPECIRAMQALSVGTSKGK
jgi:hypothetical protein